MSVILQGKFKVIKSFVNFKNLKTVKIGRLFMNRNLITLLREHNLNNSL